ncbi:MAG: hypothetical protein U1F67_20745 [Rubrivivax sp.]
MNERYAVDPASPASARELKLLLDLFGFETGRFLSCLPQDWPRRVTEHLRALSDLERARAVELLRRRHGALLPLGAALLRYVEPWASSAAAALARRLVDGVVAGNANAHGWPSVEQVLFDESCALPSGRGAHVPMRASAYADCARPLLLASAEVVLVDRFFSLRDRNGQMCRRRVPVLEALIRAAEASQVCEGIRLVLSQDALEQRANSGTSLEGDLESVLAAAGSKRVSIEYDVRDDLGHGRYLLSMHGGLQFDQGFEEHVRGSSRNHVHWLSAPELGPLLDQYLRKTDLARR